MRYRVRLETACGCTQEWRQPQRPDQHLLEVPMRMPAEKWGPAPEISKAGPEWRIRQFAFKNRERPPSRPDIETWVYEEVVT